MKNKTPSAQLGIADTEPTLQLFLPVAAKHEITLRAAETGEIVRMIVMRALDAYGFHVPKESLVDRRKLP